MNTIIVRILLILAVASAVAALTLGFLATPFGATVMDTAIQDMKGERGGATAPDSQSTDGQPANATGESKQEPGNAGHGSKTDESLATAAQPALEAIAIVAVVVAVVSLFESFRKRRRRHVAPA